MYIYICIYIRMYVYMRGSGGAMDGPAGYWPTQFSVWPTQFIGPLRFLAHPFFCV